jgi:hypothetical protein
MAPIGCPEMSVQNYRSLLREVPKEGTSQVMQIWVVTVVSIQTAVFLIIIKHWALCRFVHRNPYFLQGHKWIFSPLCTFFVHFERWQHILLLSITVLVHGKQYFSCGCKWYNMYLCTMELTIWCSVSTVHFGKVCILHYRIHLQTCDIAASIVGFQILLKQFYFVAQSYNVDSIREFFALMSD